MFNACIRISTIVIVVSLLVEVLPLIATHYIDVMNLSKVLQILCVEVEREVVCVLCVPTLASIVVVVIIVTAVAFVALSRLQVHTCVHVKVKVFKSMYLIVKLDVSGQFLAL